MKLYQQKHQATHRKQYYVQNRDRILQKLGTKAQCPHCQRCVAIPNMKKYQLTKLCQTRSQSNE